MPFAITTRLLGFVSAGLGIALAMAIAFGWVQTDRLSAAKGLVASLRNETTLLTQRVKSDAQVIATRDEMIASQNEAVKAMQAASDADRAAYLSRIAAAEKLAKVQKARADDIMARKSIETDELGRCREAEKLIQEMVGADPQP